MKVLSVNIKHFLALDTASFNLDNRGLLLIEGENLDDESANSNGAGKSSIVDALCWALFGKTARGITGDAVINRKAKKDCSVEVNLQDDDGFTYQIIRRRGCKKGVPDLEVNELCSAVTLTKTTVAETQKVVEGILGCSYEVFTSSIYAGQEKMPDLPAMTDKQLKTLIEEAAGIDKLQRASEETRVRRLEAIKNYEEAQTVCLYKEKALNDKQNELTDLMDEHKNYKTKSEQEVAACEKNLQEAKDKAPLAPISEKERSLVNVHKPRLVSILANYHELEQEVIGKERAVAEAHTKVLMAQNALRQEQEEKQKCLNEIANIDKKVGTKCRECGKVYRKEDLNEAREAINAKILTIDSRISTVNLEIKGLQEQEARARGIAENARKALPDIADVSKKINQIDEIWNRALNRERANEERTKGINALQEKLERAKEAVKNNPYSKLIIKKQDELNFALNDQAEAKQQLEKAKYTVKVYDNLNEVFGVKGIRAAILDTITPLLNDRTAFYLNQLSDGEISATWQTLTKTTKGEFKEKFSIDVLSVYGANSFAGLSGGEKRKVRVATSMALQDLVASRAEKPINLYIADEVDHALDASGLERLMGILEEKAKSCGTVLVISHNSLKDWISQTIKVVKEGGMAKIKEE